tara:strand:+ start:1583 stop:2047 length:465 start_codon:yes stop_codon:yes gene_type:complete
MSTLIGTYECKMDIKGRLMFPSSFKKQLEDKLNKGFILKRSVFQRCLELFPLDEWEKTMNGVNRLNRFVKKNNDFIRRYTAGLKSIELDNVGRILVPKDLIKFADLKKNLVMTSAVNIIEIWDKELYEKSINDSEIDFAQLTEDVMGNTSDNVS